MFDTPETPTTVEIYECISNWRKLFTDKEVEDALTFLSEKNRNEWGVVRDEWGVVRDERGVTVSLQGVETDVRIRLWCGEISNQTSRRIVVSFLGGAIWCLGYSPMVLMNGVKSDAAEIIKMLEFRYP